MTKKTKPRLTRPTPQNVELGDLLVFAGQSSEKKWSGSLSLYRIVEVTETCVIAHSRDHRGDKDRHEIQRRYQDALVLKKDGSYLVGRDFIIPPMYRGRLLDV